VRAVAPSQARRGASHRPGAALMPRGWALPLRSTPQSPKPPNPHSHEALSPWQWGFLVPPPLKKTFPKVGAIG